MENFKVKKEFKNDKAIIDVEIEFTDGRLSIQGETREYVDGLLRYSSGGQNTDDLVKFFGYNPKALRLFEIWERWHLNDMHAGDELQEQFLRALKATGWQYSYEDACIRLEEQGILTHAGYRYGTAWKKETVPAEILKELRAL